MFLLLSQPLFNPFFQNGEPVYGLLPACHMGIDLANRNEGKHRNCNSQIRSNLNSFFHRLYFVNWQLNLIKSLWLNEFILRQIWWSQSRPYSNEIVNDCPIKNSNNFFCFRKSNDIITINKLKDLTSKEKEFSNLVLNEKKYFCRCCKF